MSGAAELYIIGILEKKRPIVGAEGEECQGTLPSGGGGLALLVGKVAKGMVEFPMINDQSNLKE